MNGQNSSSSSNGAHLKSVESLSISPELFEKLYLSPENNVHGDLRKTFGNPTPLAIVGFVVALSPLSIELMGWRGASGLSATAGANWFFGGLLLVVSGLLEFFLGNTFPSVVFMSYGAHFLTFAATFQPFYNAIAAYSPDGTQTRTSPTSPSSSPLHPPNHQNTPKLTPPPLPTNRNTRIRLLLRILRPLHGFPLLHLPHLLPPHKPHLRIRLHRRLTRFRARCRLVLDYGAGNECWSYAVERCGRGVLRRCGYGVVFVGGDYVRYVGLALGIEQSTSRGFKHDDQGSQPEEERLSISISFG